MTYVKAEEYCESIGGWLALEEVYIVPKNPKRRLKEKAFPSSLLNRIVGRNLLCRRDFFVKSCLCSKKFVKSTFSAKKLVLGRKFHSQKSLQTIFRQFHEIFCFGYGISVLRLNSLLTFFLNSNSNFTKFFLI